MCIANILRISQQSSGEKARKAYCICPFSHTICTYSCVALFYPCLLHLPSSKLNPNREERAIPIQLAFPSHAMSDWSLSCCATMGLFFKYRKAVRQPERASSKGPTRQLLSLSLQYYHCYCCCCCNVSLLPSAKRLNKNQK